MKSLDAEAIYDAIYEDEDARVCKDISDAACTNVPANFFTVATATALGKLADALANTKTTLPWLLNAAGAPGWSVSLLVPLRESGSMLPQLAIGGMVRGYERRKWFYAGGAAAQALALGGIALALLTLEGTSAGVATVTGVILFSLARAFCSVASKDVMGKTVPKTRRGRVSGLASSIAGIGTLATAALLFFLQASVTSYVWIVAGGALLWLLAGLLFSSIEEEAGATEGGANGLLEGVAKLRLMLDDADFRRFVIARALLMGSALAAPLLVVLGQQRTDASLLLFLLAQGFAALVSGHLWGMAADRSSRKLLIGVGIGTATLGAVVFATDALLPDLMSTTWFLPAAFFVLAVLHDGVRLARKTYLVDLGSGNKRTDYTAVSNTIIGVALLGAGALTSWLQGFGLPAAIGALSGAALIAALYALRLPEVQSE